MPCQEVPPPGAEVETVENHESAELEAPLSMMTVAECDKLWPLNAEACPKSAAKKNSQHQGGDGRSGRGVHGGTELPRSHTLETRNHTPSQAQLEKEEQG